MAFVLVRRNTDGSYVLEAAADATLILVDMEAMEADPSLAMGHINVLLQQNHPDAYTKVSELVTWLQANATITP